MRNITILNTAALVVAASAPAIAQQGAEIYTPRARAEALFRNENRAALGLSTTATGTLRDTLGLMITSITRGSPAEKAGLEEGNRLQAINGVSLRASAADVEDAEMSNALTHRLTRELAKAKPGDEVELRVYKEGRTQSIRVKAADSDSLFRNREFVRLSRSDMEDRPALGFSIGSSGSRRDTLGVLVIAVSDSSPAAAAGIEEGNRIAAINGVNLRVSREDAGDGWLGNSKAQRLQREISQLKPGSDVTLRVYSNGQFRDVRVKVARARDLPRRSGMTIFGGNMMPTMAPMPPMPAMPMTPSVPRIRSIPMESMHFEIGPQIEQALHEVGVQLERIRPQLDRALRDLPGALDRVRIPTVRVDVRRTVRV